MFKCEISVLDLMASDCTEYIESYSICVMVVLLMMIIIFFGAFCLTAIVFALLYALFLSIASVCMVAILVVTELITAIVDIFCD